jgi:hypothetical protein
MKVFENSPQKQGRDCPHLRNRKITTIRAHKIRPAIIAACGIWSEKLTAWPSTNDDRKTDSKFMVGDQRHRPHSYGNLLLYRLSKGGLVCGISDDSAYSPRGYPQMVSQ